MCGDIYADATDNFKHPLGSTSWERADVSGDGDT